MAERNSPSTTNPGAIDRQSLVRRHKVVLTVSDPLSPLSVGNGELAFTADVTGLQSFPEAYAAGTPLCTMAQWGWHTSPTADGKLPEIALEEFESHGRMVQYATRAKGQEAAFNYLRQNPHRLHLGRVGFSIHTRGGRLARLEDLTGVRQELDLWAGRIESRFAVDGTGAVVLTCCHPERDAISCDVSGELFEGGWMSVVFRFPGASPEISAADWDHPERHSTKLLRSDGSSAVLGRVLDGDRYFVSIDWSGGKLERRGEHEWELIPSKGAKRFWFWCEFTAKDDAGAALDAEGTSAAAREHWEKFWSESGAVDFSGSSDPRAVELERRVVLSQYLTAIQCAGSLPPQETGLTCNSWYGKFHLEMHLWHAAHFALWGRSGLLEKSLEWYRTILRSAKGRANSNGYAGARWPKMTDPSGRDSPSAIGPLLIWQQPHPILMAELCYRAEPTERALEWYGEIVQESAEFMASYAAWDEGSQTYILGPPVIPAQEDHAARETWNPTFELAYWRQGLKIAQQWRVRRGLTADPKWEHVIAHLAPLPVKDGLYLAQANYPNTFTEKNHDHPSMLGAMGLLSRDGVDPTTMRRTLQKVIDVWDWPSTWGWDYPLMAMTAARLGEPKLAVSLLLRDTPKNQWGINGHCFQRKDLTVYLPSNGGLLLAVAMMAGGWDGAPVGDAPGFPADGSWVVRSEGILRMV